MISEHLGRSSTGSLPGITIYSIASRTSCGKQFALSTYTIGLKIIARNNILSGNWNETKKINIFAEIIKKGWALESPFAYANVWLSIIRLHSNYCQFQSQYNLIMKNHVRMFACERSHHGINLVRKVSFYLFKRETRMVEGFREVHLQGINFLQGWFSSRCIIFNFNISCHMIYRAIW